MNKNFEMNILDKVNLIQDAKVKKICEIGIVSAQENIHSSRTVAVDRVATEIKSNLLKIALEDKE